MRDTEYILGSFVASKNVIWNTLNFLHYIAVSERTSDEFKNGSLCQYVRVDSVNNLVR
jgi:hypothetical protein